MANYTHSHFHDLVSKPFVTYCIIVSRSCNAINDAPSSSLMDSTMNPKVKTMEGEGVRVCSLARNTLGVEECARISGWVLGRFKSKSTTHTDLHKPNNKLVKCVVRTLLVHGRARGKHGLTTAWTWGKPPRSPL
jgi:hypothetical protein